MKNLENSTLYLSEVQLVGRTLLEEDEDLVLDLPYIDLLQPQSK